MNKLPLKTFEGRQDETRNYVQAFDSLILLLRNHKSLPGEPFTSHRTTYNA